MKTLSWQSLTLAALLALGALALSPAPAAAPAQQASDIHDLVFLGEARPVFLRLHVRLDGLPVEAAWDGFMKYLFGYLDIDGDGVLSKDEAQRAPAANQIRNGALAGRGLGRGGARGTAAPTLADLDADKDGKVTLAEMSAYYRKSGFVPFQFQLDPPPANPLGGAALLYGRTPEPPVDVVSKAIFALLDTDKDGKLSKEELSAAPDVLLRLDEDTDEIVTARELVPNYRPSTDLLAGVAMMAGRATSGATGNKTVLPVTTPGEAPADLVRLMQERYGLRDKSVKGLSRKALGLDEPTFRFLDTNSDGVLDGKELAGFVKRAPDLELVLRLGRKGEAARLEAMGGGKSPLAGQLKSKDGVALLDLGLTRIELRGSEELPDSTSSLSGLLRQQYVAQFKAADKDNNGYLDKKEAEASRTYRDLFHAMDRDGDGKLYEKEVMAYLDHYQEIQERAAGACVALVLTDQSRGLFDLLDVNRDGRLSVREMRGASELLKQLDRDGKGHLTKADLPRSYQLLLRRGPASGGLDGGAAAFFALYRGGYDKAESEEGGQGPLWFRKMDRNRDGDVSRKEFLFSDELFRKIDTDGDGLISLEEAQRYEDLRKKAGD